jgi:D-alanine-D-alanine ligase
MPKIRRVLVITGDHGAPDPTKRGGQYNEEDMTTHGAMRAAFESLGDFAFEFLTDHGHLLDRLREDPPDLVVNFCDTGYRNVPAFELNVPAYLELLGVPYTGAPPAAMVVCYDKQIVRLVAQALGVEVPRESFLSGETGFADIPDILPALIKPNRADGSVGITKDAVVRSQDEARAYLRWLENTLPGCDALVQEYLPGPEYSIGLIGNPETALDALPALEVDFSGLPANLNPILSFESKAMPDSPYWTEIRFKRAELPPEDEERLGTWSKRLFRRLGLRDYGRFDFRTDAQGVIKLMEVNPNPAWANDGKLALMAGFAGVSYRDHLRRIPDAAFARIAAAESASLP